MFGVVQHNDIKPFGAMSSAGRQGIAGGRGRAFWRQELEGRVKE